MKKLSIFAVLALLVLGLSAVAQAADIKATGSWQIQAQFRNNQDFTDQDEDARLLIHQRMRTAFHFIANENLKAVLDTQIGGSNEGWGQGVYTIGSGRNTSANGPSGANGGAIMLRQGYLDFMVPGTQINTKVGFQTVALPSSGLGGGSVILDDQAAGIVMAAPVLDTVKVVGGFVRASQGTDTPASGSALDAVFLAAPITPKGFSITPFAAFAYGGSTAGAVAGGTTSANGFSSANSTSTSGVRGYWGGVAFTMDAFQPFKVFADLNYGKATYNNYVAGQNNSGREGWFFQTAVDYTGLTMMTPSVFFAYSSGEKDPGSNGSGATDSKSHRMPQLAAPQTWALGSFFFGDRDLIMRGINAHDSANEDMGFWALGLSLKDIALIDKVKHTAHVMYVKGTNNAGWVRNRQSGVVYGSMLSDKDSLWEVDFNTKYEMYKELNAYLNLGYINQNFDKDVWRNVSTRYSEKDANAYKIAMGLTYAF